jgi:Zn-dependent protease with chaperone function
VHEELRAAGLRRMRIWTGWLLVVSAFVGALTAALTVFQTDWPPTTDWFDDSLRTIAMGAIVGAAFVAVAIYTFGPALAARRAWPRRTLQPAPDLVPLAEGIALARGEPTPRVWRLITPAPNLACFPGLGGRHIVVSTAAEAGLTTDELEALMALQFSLLIDEGAARVRRPLVVAALTVMWTFWAMMVGTTVAVLRDVVWAGLTINVGLWTAIGTIALVVLVQRRIRWSWGIVSDAVALETTRHPQPLVSALRRMASYNGDQVPVRRTYGVADPFWVLPVRAKVAVATMVVNDEARSRTSTEQVSDAALLLRAGIVERVCVGGEPGTLASWQAAEATFARLGLAAGDRVAVDGTVDGVTVGVAGATGGLGPVSGVWRAPPPNMHLERRLRPWRPDAAALAAYDAAVGRTGS